MSETQVNFEAWKLLLEKDCERIGKLQAFHCLGDYSLRLLWKANIEPSVQGVIGGTQEGRAA
jgi:hypothetical protein